MARSQPPRLAVLLIRLLGKKRTFEVMAGDLFEEWNSACRSTWWFWQQTFSVLPRRFHSSRQFFYAPQRPLHNPLETVYADLRYALRTLRRTPTLTAAILLATALGIGVNTGVFSLMNAMFLRSLPVKDASNVVSIYQIFHNLKNRHVDGEHSLFSWPEYQQYRDHNQVLLGLAAYAPFEATMRTATGVRGVQGQLVSCNYFAVLGRTPVLGRDFSPGECSAPDSSPYIVLSHAYWKSHFNGDEKVLGRSVVINRSPFTIVGVAPKDFHGTFLAATDFWAPITMQEEVKPHGDDLRKYLTDTNLSWLLLLGRLKSGTSVDQVRSNLAVIAKRIDEVYPGRETKLDIQVATLFSEPEERQNIWPMTAVLMIAVGLVLLIACANVANLLLARASGRQREIAVRLSMGATRSRLVRQLLTESLLLSLIGGALGAVLSFWIFDIFYHWMFANLPFDIRGLTINLSPDIRVLGFALTLSLLTGITFGLLPAFQATRLDLNRVLKQESRAAGRQSRRWLRSTLLTTQVAVCLVLLVAAGLIMRGLVAVQSLDPGFTTQNVVATRLDLLQQGYTDIRAAAYHQELMDNLRAEPGVQAVAMASVIPLSGSRYEDEGSVESHQGNVQLYFNRVSPDYFEVLDIPIIRGRGFRRSENGARDQVLIVSESTSRHLWPGVDPIGKRIRIGDEKVYSEVVGVARDVYATNLSEVDGIYIYRPVDPRELRLSVLVRGKESASVAKQLRAVVAKLDPNVFVDGVELKENLKTWRAPSRILAVLSGALSLLALLLAATGIFGFINYSVSQRTQEIGTRMALGANPRSILRLLISQSLRPVFVGAALGLAGAAVVSRILSSLLFGVSPLDALTFLSMLLVLFAVAILASYAPTARAARIEPAAALRHE